MTAKNKGGRPRYVPTVKERERVKLLAAIGYTKEQISIVMGITQPTLRRAFKPELTAGALEINGQVGGKLYQKAMSGDVSSMIFWAKTRMGWKDASRIEHTGKDGGPIEYANLSDEEIEARIMAHEMGLGQSAPNPTEH